MYFIKYNKLILSKINYFTVSSYNSGLFLQSFNRDQTAILPPFRLQLLCVSAEYLMFIVSRLVGVRTFLMAEPLILNLPYFLFRCFCSFFEDVISHLRDMIEDVSPKIKGSRLRPNVWPAVKSRLQMMTMSNQISSHSTIMLGFAIFLQILVGCYEYCSVCS